MKKCLRESPLSSKPSSMPFGKLLKACWSFSYDQSQIQKIIFLKAIKESDEDRNISQKKKSLKPLKSQSFLTDQRQKWPKRNTLNFSKQNICESQMKTPTFSHTQNANRFQRLSQGKISEKQVLNVNSQSDKKTSKFLKQTNNSSDSLITRKLNMSLNPENILQNSTAFQKSPVKITSFQNLDNDVHQALKTVLTILRSDHQVLGKQDDYRCTQSIKDKKLLEKDDKKNQTISVGDQSTLNQGNMYGNVKISDITATPSSDNEIPSAKIRDFKKPKYFQIPEKISEKNQESFLIQSVARSENIKTLKTLTERQNVDNQTGKTNNQLYSPRTLQRKRSSTINIHQDCEYRDVVSVSLGENTGTQYSFVI